MRILRPLTEFASRPQVVFACGLILMLTSLIELGDTAYTFADGARSEHGTLLYGVLVMLRSLNDLNESVTRLADATSRET